MQIQHAITKVCAKGQQAGSGGVDAFLEGPIARYGWEHRVHKNKKRPLFSGRSNHRVFQPSMRSYYRGPGQYSDRPLSENNPFCGYFEPSEAH